MEKMLAGWVGKHVVLVLKVGGLVPALKIKGNLLAVGDAGVTLKMPKGLTFVPLGSIFHVSLMDAE